MKLLENAKKFIELMKIPQLKFNTRHDRVLVTSGIDCQDRAEKLRRSDDPLRAQAGVVLEEVGELLEAIGEGREIDVFDAVIDVIYAASTLAAALNLPLEEGYNVVHESNMTKIANTGVIANKGRGWIDPRPELRRLLLLRDGHANLL